MPPRGDTTDKRKRDTDADEEFLVGNRVPHGAKRQAALVRRNRCWLIVVSTSVFIIGILSLIALGLAGKDYYIDDAIDRYCLNALVGAQVRAGASGDPDAFGFGWIQIDSHAYSVDYELIIGQLDGNVTTVAIYGPMTATSGAQAPLAYDLSAIVASTSPSLNGTAFVGGARLTPIDSALATQIHDMPSAYYVQVASDVYADGGIRAPLGVLC